MIPYPFSNMNGLQCIPNARVRFFTVVSTRQAIRHTLEVRLWSPLVHSPNFIPRDLVKAIHFSNRKLHLSFHTESLAFILFHYVVGSIVNDMYLI